MPRSSPASSRATTARTVRFPDGLRARIIDDAERCGRSFEAHVIAILRHHYGEDVDLAPAAESILALAVGSFAGLSEADRADVTRRLGAGKKRRPRVTSSCSIPTPCRSSRAAMAWSPQGPARTLPRMAA